MLDDRTILFETRDGQAHSILCRSGDSRDKLRRRRRSERDMVHIEPVEPLQPAQ